MDPRKFATFIHLVMHPMLLIIAILHFSDQAWMPWMLVIPYVFFACTTWPGLKPSTVEGLFWFFGGPFMSAIAGYALLKEYGAPDHISVVALSYAMFSLYVFSNVIAILVNLTPVMATAPELRYAVRKNPIGFLMLSGLSFFFVYQLVSWLQIALN